MSNGSERVAGVLNECGSTLKIKRSALLISRAHLISYSLCGGFKEGMAAEFLRPSRGLISYSIGTSCSTRRLYELCH